MDEKALSKEEIIQEMLGILNNNNKSQAANELYEFCVYIDNMTKKMQDMTVELSEVRKQLREMQEDTLPNNLKKTLNDAADRLENRCREIKAQLFEVKDTVKTKAREVVADFKFRGKEALNKVSEVFGVKEKLQGIREKVKGSIEDSERTIRKINAFGEGMRDAGQRAANTFRTFADKSEVDYSQKQKKFSKTAVVRKPWEVQKKLLQSVKLHLDGAIDNVENLSMDVAIGRFERNNRAMEKEIRSVLEPRETMLAVAEPGEYRYGADAFKAMQKQVGENAVVPVVKQGKSR